MTTVMTSHISIDDRGVAWIDGTTAKVKELAAEKAAFGWTPEELHRQHPHIPLAKIYAALAYYYDHQSEMDGEIERDRRTYEEAREAAGESPLAKRLRAVGKLP